MNCKISELESMNCADANESVNGAVVQKEARMKPTTERIVTPRLLIVPIEEYGESVEFLSDLLAQEHVRDSLFTITMESRLQMKHKNENGKWSKECINEFIGYWTLESLKGHGCGLYIAVHKDKENMVAQSLQEDTYPPRKLLKNNSSSSSSRTYKTIHCRRRDSIETRQQIGIIAVSYTEQETRIIDVVVSNIHLGQGYATEGAKAILKNGFADIQIHPPVAPKSMPLSLRNVFPDGSLGKKPDAQTKNIKTIPSPIRKFVSFVEQDSDHESWMRVLEKLGFKHTSSFIAMDSIKCDVCSITKDEFEDLWALG